VKEYVPGQYSEDAPPVELRLIVSVLCTPSPGVPELGEKEYVDPEGNPLRLRLHGCVKSENPSITV
jgi:hypothetical protein